MAYGPCTVLIMNQPSFQLNQKSCSSPTPESEDFYLVPDIQNADHLEMFHLTGTIKIRKNFITHSDTPKPSPPVLTRVNFSSVNKQVHTSVSH